MSTIIGRHYRRKIVRKVVPFGGILYILAIVAFILLVFSYWLIAVIVAAVLGAMGIYGSRSQTGGNRNGR